MSDKLFDGVKEFHSDFIENREIFRQLQQEQHPPHALYRLLRLAGSAKPDNKITARRTVHRSQHCQHCPGSQHEADGLCGNFRSD